MTTIPPEKPEDLKRDIIAVIRSYDFASPKEMALYLYPNLTPAQKRWLTFWGLKEYAREQIRFEQIDSFKKPPGDPGRPWHIDNYHWVPAPNPTLNDGEKDKPKGEWKRLGEMTVDELARVVDNYDRIAKKNLARHEAFDTLLEVAIAEGVELIGDLTRDGIEAILHPWAEEL